MIRRRFFFQEKRKRDVDGDSRGRLKPLVVIPTSSGDEREWRLGRPFAVFRRTAELYVLLQYGAGDEAVGDGRKTW